MDTTINTIVNEPVYKAGAALRTSGREEMHLVCNLLSSYPDEFKGNIFQRKRRQLTIPKAIKLVNRLLV